MRRAPAAPTRPRDDKQAASAVRCCLILARSPSLASIPLDSSRPRSALIRSAVYPAVNACALSSSVAATNSVSSCWSRSISACAALVSQFLDAQSGNEHSALALACVLSTTLRSSLH